MFHGIHLDEYFWICKWLIGPAARNGFILVALIHNTVGSVYSFWIGGVAGGYSAASKLLKRDLSTFFTPLSCLTGPKIHFGYPCRKKGDVKREI